MSAAARWSPEDVEMLAGLCGDMPWPLVVDAFGRWATRNGRPQRTENALLRLCNRRRIPRRTCGAWITTDAIMQLAQVTHGRVTRWIQSGELPARKFNAGGIHYLKRADLRTFARRHPHEFGGVSLPALIQLLDNEQLAQRLHEMELPRPVQLRPVRCVETGRQFESIRAAARACYVTHQRMLQVVGRPERTANGLHWEVAA
jgi:hypothetical protein